MTTPDGVVATHAITGWALERGYDLGRLSVAQPSLEDVYLRLTDTDTEADREESPA